jgi:hypothetical protein
VPTATRLKQLVIVCVNCHRSLDRQRGLSACATPGATGQGVKAVNYYIDLFTPDTYETFSRTDRTITGVKVEWESRAHSIKQGDRLIAYLTEERRWIGVLEVLHGPYKGTANIFQEVDDPYVIRFKVKPLVWLPREQGISIKEKESWDVLSLTRGEPENSRRWIGMVRSPLYRLEARDGRHLDEVLHRRAVELGGSSTLMTKQGQAAPSSTGAESQGTGQPFQPPAITDGMSSSPDADNEEAEEGRRLRREHYRRERKPRLVHRMKQRVLQTTGRLACEACGFDFMEVYGKLGDGFAECHHRLPLGQLDGERKTRLADLGIVCANCHRILHRSKDGLTIEGLHALLVARGALWVHPTCAGTPSTAT